jgi:hypothetical protein
MTKLHFEILNREFRISSTRNTFPVYFDSAIERNSKFPIQNLKCLNVKIQQNIFEMSNKLVICAKLISEYGSFQSKPQVSP